ncbi:hypothetical protein FACS189427_02810 [Planctomycetales bacterium]|nr:hypothetical protein FACS189427_02810 [Planctomycetales bacterium]
MSKAREWTFIQKNGEPQKFTGTLIGFEDNYAVFTDTNGKKTYRVAKQFSESDMKLMKKFLEYFPDKNRQSPKRR